MPLYRIEQYQIYVQAYNVRADSEAEAVQKVLSEDESIVEEIDEAQYLQVDEEHGLPAEDSYADLAEELEDRGIQCTDVIPSIRDIMVIIED